MPYLNDGKDRTSIFYIKQGTNKYYSNLDIEPIFEKYADEEAEKYIKLEEERKLQMEQRRNEGGDDRGYR